MKWYYLALLFLVSSCSEGFRRDEASVSPAGQVSINSPQGAWQSCSNYMGWSFKHVLALGASNFMFNMTAYSAEDCVSGSEEFLESKMGYYTSTEDAITVTVKTFTQTPLSGADVIDRNGASKCGFTDWAQNIPKLLNGVNCDGETVNEGETTALSYALSGPQLTLTFPGDYSIEFDHIFDLEHTNIGQSLADGNYFSVEEHIALFIEVLNGTYQTFIYILGTKSVSAESGTMTSANNQMSYTKTGVLPGHCANPPRSGDHTFTTGAGYFALNPDGAGHNIVYMKTSMTESQFRDHFLNGGFTENCM